MLTAPDRHCPPTQAHTKKLTPPLKYFGRSPREGVTQTKPISGIHSGKKEVYLMAYVRDLWTKPNPDKTSRIKRVHSTRWGKGKRWQTVWVENGRETTKTFTTRNEAELYAARTEVGHADGTWITKDKIDITLSDLWEPWIAAKGNISDKTKRDYLSYWNVHIKPHWGQTPCTDIQRSMINAWLPTLSTMKNVPANQPPRPLSASAIRKVGLIIHGILDLAVELGIIHKNPIKTSDFPKQKKAERRYLKITEVDELLRQAPTQQARLLLHVLLMTGLRPGEAKALKVKDLDPIRGRLMIRRDVDDLGREDATKTRNHRDVPIGGETLRLLEQNAEGKDHDTWLIPDEHGHVWTTARWRVVWKNLCIWTGIGNLDTYELRHTAASIAIASGADVKTVQLMLGHSSAAMTLDVYAHLWEEGLDAIPGAMEAHMESERKRANEQSALREHNEAKRRRKHFKVIG